MSDHQSNTAPDEAINETRAALSALGAYEIDEALAEMTAIDARNKANAAVRSQLERASNKRAPTSRLPIP